MGDKVDKVLLTNEDMFWLQVLHVIEGLRMKRNLMSVITDQGLGRHSRSTCRPGSAKYAPYFIKNVKVGIGVLG